MILELDRFMPCTTWSELYKAQRYNLYKNSSSNTRQKGNSSVLSIYVNLLISILRDVTELSG